MKQTAVEWLHEQLLKILIDNQIQQADYLFEQAKEIEKQQVINAFISGEHQQGYQAEAETYYNETYIQANDTQRSRIQSNA
jgi:hydroxymethylpyrimidine/phosphomethylpyrimidine kinase